GVVRKTYLRGHPINNHTPHGTLLRRGGI
ncbi:hypothetical protein ABIB49_003800, partial [Arthrobacter sp. UYCu512]